MTPTSARGELRQVRIGRERLRLLRFAAVASARSSAGASGSGTRMRDACALYAISGSTSLRLSAIRMLVKGRSQNGASDAQSRSTLVRLPCS